VHKENSDKDYKRLSNSPKALLEVYPMSSEKTFSLMTFRLFNLDKSPEGREIRAIFEMKDLWGSEQPKG